jgi:phosphatidylglycerol:prolipoprotein diacylglycerol transferase
MEGIFSQGPHLIHRIDPVLLDVRGFKLYYYGLAYSLGFLGIWLWFNRRRTKLGWSTGEVYDYSIVFSLCVLAFGRAFEILFYELGYYLEHPWQVFCWWRGGMASHGLLLGAVAGTWFFSRLRKRSFLLIGDEAVIPGVLFLGLGRIGNFINGQICGYVTHVPWGVKFPDLEGFRHPVALYEALKNFLIIPILLSVRKRTRPGTGKLVAHFVFWYGFLRFFTDRYREYGNEILGIGTGQYFNIFMAALGLFLLAWLRRRGPGPDGGQIPDTSAAKTGTGREVHFLDRIPLNVKRLVFVLILLFSMTIPSSWTQGVLKDYREKLRKESSATLPPRGDQPAAAARSGEGRLRRLANISTGKGGELCFPKNSSGHTKPFTIQPATTTSWTQGRP